MPEASLDAKANSKKGMFWIIVEFSTVDFKNNFQSKENKFLACPAVAENSYHIQGLRIFLTVTENTDD